MIALIFVPYRLYTYIAPFGMLFGLVLLALTVFTPLGETINYATRWIKVGDITIMPGDIAKITAILFVAWFFTKYRHQATSFVKGYLPMVVLIIVYFALIYKQPNLSTAIIVCGIVAIMTFIAGSKGQYIALTAIGGGAGVYGLITMKSEGEHLKRLTGFWDPFSDPQGDFYQTVQSLLALGAGGVTGVGPGRSIQKALYLPYAQNDFIFAIIGEEIGFIGCIAVLCAFLFLIWRCALVSINAPDRFGMLIGAGITIMLALQVVLNIAVVTSLIPPTGVTLPFISYGGNGILLFMGAMGIMLNISRETARAHVSTRKRGRRDIMNEDRIDGRSMTESA
jgi:cell division protein FtsW